MSNPEYKAYGSTRIRWIEKDEPGEFRDANEYLRGTCLAHTTGYYCDEFYDTTAVPALYVTRVDCPACADPNRTTDCADCETCGGSGDIFTYYAAVRDPWNTGCGTVDFAESYADAEEAARAAHGLAERYAEVERQIREW